MKHKSWIGVAVVLALCAGLSLLSLQRAVAHTQDPARQLQQTEQVKVWPSKAKRWALVIGVDKYSDPQISPLKGADNDARTLSDSLVRYAGFPQDQVILLATDQPAERQPTRLNILRRLSNLASVVPKDGLLLISFAGHGIERGGQAYLIPSDSQITDDISLLEESAVSVARMKDRIRSMGVGQVVIFLDACRNDPGGRADAPNPLTQAYVNGFNFDVRNREVTAFATLYATAVGQRAYEYTEKKQGYFTYAVVEGLKGAAANDKGEVTLASLVKYVQDSVPKRVAIDLGASRQQRPFSQMEGYKADELVIAVGGVAASTASNPPTVDPAAFELSYWETIKNSNNPEDYKAYLDKYPDGQFAALAKNRISTFNASAKSESKPSDEGATELAFWDAIKTSNSADDYRAYLRRYPNGAFKELANNRLNSIAPPGPGKVGLILQTVNNQVVITAVLPSSPGIRAGLKPGDQVTKINGHEVTGLALDKISPLLSGNEGTEVTFTVLSPGTSTARDVSVTTANAALLDKEEEVELAKQTKSFRASFGIKIAMVSVFNQGTLRISPLKIDFICDGDKYCKAGQAFTMDCDMFSKAVTDGATLREIVLGKDKYRLNASSKIDAANILQQIRQFCSQASPSKRVSSSPGK